jgi:hypothetical protein
VNVAVVPFKCGEEPLWNAKRSVALETFPPGRTPHTPLTHSLTFSLSGSFEHIHYHHIQPYHIYYKTLSSTNRA